MCTGWKCFSSRDDAGSFLLAACLPSRQGLLGSWDSELSHVAPSNTGFRVSESDGERLKTSPLRLKKPLDLGRNLLIESWGLTILGVLVRTDFYRVCTVHVLSYQVCSCQSYRWAGFLYLFGMGKTEAWVTPVTWPAQGQANGGWTAWPQVPPWTEPDSQESASWGTFCLMTEGVGGCGTRCLQEPVTSDRPPPTIVWSFPPPMAVEKYPRNLVAQFPSEIEIRKYFCDVYSSLNSFLGVLKPLSFLCPKVYR